MCIYKSTTSLRSYQYIKHISALDYRYVECIVRLFKWKLLQFTNFISIRLIVTSQNPSLQILCQLPKNKMFLLIRPILV